MKKILSKSLFACIRDGVAYSFSWFVLLALIICLLTGKKDIGVDFLGMLLAFCVLAAIEFVFFFSNFFIKRKGFIFRLNGFVALFLPTQIAFLYAAGLFSGAGTVIQWVIFVGIIVLLYLVCIVLDQTVCRKQGKEYTVQLDRYKEKRRDESTT